MKYDSMLASIYEVIRDILRHCIISPSDKSFRFCHGTHGQCSARTHTQFYILMMPGGLCQRSHKFVYLIVYEHPSGLALHLHEIFFRSYLLHIFQRVSLGPVLHYVYLRPYIGITHGHLYHESVQLSLGQHLCAGRSDGVLSSHYDKRLRYHMDFSVHGKFSLLHHLQKRRLSLAGSSVNLICQQNIRENTTRTKFKF